MKEDVQRAIDTGVNGVVMEIFLDIILSEKFFVLATILRLL